MKHSAQKEMDALDEPLFGRIDRSIMALPKTRDEQDVRS